MAEADESEFVVSFDVGSGGGADGGEGRGAEVVNGSLPADIASVWGSDPTVAFLVREWGVDRFRGSWLHRMAVLEAARATKTRLRPDFKGGSK